MNYSLFSTLFLSTLVPSLTYAATSYIPYREADRKVAPRVKGTVSTTLDAPKKQPQSKSRFGGNIEGSYTYWLMQQEGLEYAQTGEPETVDTNIEMQGKVLSIPFNYKSGFKVGAGYQIPSTPWDVRAEYTWFRNNRFSFADKPENSVIVTYYVIGLKNISNVTRAESSWAINFNSLNLESGVSFEYDEVTIRPHIGLKGFWEDQLQRVAYLGGTQGHWILYTQDMFGIGIRGGAQVEWKFWDYFSLIGECSATSMWHDADVKLKSFEITSTEAVVQVENTVYDNDFLSPVFETRLGVTAGYPLMDDQVRIYTKLLWDLQIWFNHLRTTSPTVSYGASRNLTARGLTATVGVDF